MKLIAFDTSTEACSVAVQIDGEVLSDHRIVQREHAGLLLPMLSKLLAEFDVSAQQVDGIVFGQGPGSFTGLRIAAATAQGLAQAIGCGVYGVSTLQAIAYGCARQRKAGRGDNGVLADHFIMSAVDARMDQIYANTYRVKSVTESEDASKTLGSVTAMAEEVVVDPDRYTWPEAISEERLLQSASSSPFELLLCGSGAERYQQVLQEANKRNRQLTVEVIPDVWPHAIDLLRLTDTADRGIWKPADQAQPVYLRNKVALTEIERSNASK